MRATFASNAGLSPYPRYFEYAVHDRITVVVFPFEDPEIPTVAAKS